jgi:hypothetical protein
VQPRRRVVERTFARARSPPPSPEGRRDHRRVLDRLRSCRRREPARQTHRPISMSSRTDS